MQDAPGVELFIGSTDLKNNFSRNLGDFTAFKTLAKQTRNAGAIFRAVCLTDTISEDYLQIHPLSGYLNKSRQEYSTLRSGWLIGIAMQIESCARATFVASLVPFGNKKRDRDNAGCPISCLTGPARTGTRKGGLKP